MSEPICICNHILLEHQPESLFCQWQHCPCQGFTEKVLDRSFEELEESTLYFLLRNLRDAHGLVFRARTNVQSIPNAKPLPAALEPLLPVLEVAELNLTVTMDLIATVLNAFNEEPYE